MKTEIFDYGMNGEGVGKIDNKIVLLPNALIGEIVEFDLVKEYSNYAIGSVKNVENCSKQRLEPPCPYYYECGGCDLQHMASLEQAKFKKMLVQKTIKKITGNSVEVEDTITSNKHFEYRNKMSFNIKNNEVGFYKNNSKDLVKIQKCLLCNQKINEILFIFNKFLQKNNKFIKNLVIRDINNQILVGVVVSADLDLNPFYTELKNRFENVGVYQILNTRKDSVVLSGKVSHVAGIKEIKIENFGLHYSVDLMGFHQTNIDIQNKIYSKVLEMIDNNSVVLNGFSGQGLLSAIVAQKAKKVYGIEINKNSHISAEKLKKDNRISNLTNICGDFYKEFDKIKEKINTIILDPTKKGCGKQAMCAIMGVENIIYISCNPIALSKDLREILNDYKIETIIPFDMFPNTKNVETLVKLKLK